MAIAQQPDVLGSSAAAREITEVLARKRKSQLRLIAERFARNRAAVAGLVILLLMIITVLLAPIIAHAVTHIPAALDPSTTQSDDLLVGPSATHPLGTDELGRDIFSRLLYGGRVSLAVGVSAMIVAITIGATIGAVAGYYGGLVDTLLMRLTDMILAVPYLLILSVLSISFADGSFKAIVLLIAAFAWAGTSRIVRGEFLSLKNREFVLAARTLGAGDIRLMLRHILPNAAAPIIVAATLQIGDNIISESVLSFFGFGLHVPLSSWGVLLNDARDFYHTAPLLLFAPGLSILVTVLCVNLMGDGLRDALDPYMTER
jgi:peptide/nickel transport system permease protein